jgi:hypothetical protein
MSGPTGGGRPASLAAALAAWQVTPAALDPGQRARLDEDGYLVVPGAISRSEAALLRERVDELGALEGDRAGIEVHQLFDQCWNHRVQLAAVAHVFGWRDFKLSSLNGRAALPGHGHQALHADWSDPVSPGHYQVCNSIWMLDDFTPENGATRVVPGSHRRGRRVADEVGDRLAPHPDEVLLTGVAGSCVVFNAHVWHGGTLNKTDSPRRALHALFCRREQTQQLIQRDCLRPERLAELSPVQRYLLEA